MVAPENLDLVVQVRALAGQWFLDEQFEDNHFSGGTGDEDEIRGPESAASGLRQSVDRLRG